MRFTLTVNGNPSAVDVPEAMPLLWVLHDVLDLKGTKYGCADASVSANKAIKVRKVWVAADIGSSALPPIHVQPDRTRRAGAATNHSGRLQCDLLGNRPADSLAAAGKAGLQVVIGRPRSSR